MKYLLKSVFFGILMPCTFSTSINYERGNNVRSRSFQVTENPIETVDITPKSNTLYNKQLIAPDKNQIYSVQPFQTVPENKYFSNDVVSYNSQLIALMINMLLRLYAIQKDGRFINDVRRNSPELIPSDPYIELLLSQYGKYLPKFSGSPKHFYSHLTTNNLHNNQPFGSYKYVQDRND